MHLLIPFAACLTPACQPIWANLKLPHLNQLLARLTAQKAADAGLQGLENSLSPPHERALAAAHGLPASDGLLPWGAARAQALGIAPPAVGLTAPSWAVITPVNWSVQTAHITMTDPAELQLDETDSRVLMAAMAPFFAQDGIDLHFDRPDRWLAAGEVFRNLPTAGIDRAIGRNVQDWQPITAGAHAAQARLLRRLQAEMQMLLYTHPLTDQRGARGLPAVNSFWVSGTGNLPRNPTINAPVEPPVQQALADVTVADALRAPALADDWSAWGRAWEALDAGVCASLLADIKNQASHGATHRLTLCGERQALTWAIQPVGIWERFRRLNANKYGELLRTNLPDML